MHHFPHHIGDYTAATAHLSFVEDAAYHRLLRLYYRDEQALPDDIATCQRRAGARSKEERRAIETVLREFFELRDDGWHQHRADREIEAYQSRANKARANGRLGGRPRTEDEPNNNQSGYSTDTQTEPIEKLTKNRKPRTVNHDDKTGAKAPGGQRSDANEQRTKLPLDWKLTTDDRCYAIDKGLDPDTGWTAFCDYFHEGRGRNEKRSLAGWSRRWRVWCNTDADRKPGGRGGQGVRPAVNSETAAFARAADRLEREEQLRRGGVHGDDDLWRLNQAGK